MTTYAGRSEMYACGRLVALVAALVVVGVAACSGIMEETGALVAGDPDAGSTSPADADPAAPDADPSAPDAAGQVDPPCAELASSIGAGYHKPGDTCLPCHNGGNVSEMTLAGTLYVDSAGSAPLAGATIHLIDANGVEITLVTTDNGNFWARDPIAFPVRAYASLCPDIPQMTDPVAATGADCNGCHGGGSRIHVP